MKNTIKIFALHFLLVFSGCVFKPDLEAIQSQLVPASKPVITSIQPTTLFTGGGTEVQITGADFGAGVSVKINGQDCQIQKLESTTKIFCLAPASAEGSFNVVVTTVNGNEANIGVSYDRLAYTKLSLLVGKLVAPVTNSDGYFSNADSLGASQMSVSGSYIYSADYDGHKIKLTNLTNLLSTSLVGTGINSGPDLAFSNPRDMTLGSPVGVFKSGNILYFCPDDKSIAKLDLDTQAVSLVAGRIPADLNTYPPGDPLGDNFDSIRQIYVQNNFLYVVDVDTIRKIDLTSPVITTVAGTSGTGVVADGIGALATFHDISRSELIGDQLYVFDQDTYSGTLRKIDLSGAPYNVSTVAGDNLALPGSGIEGADGVGSLASFNVVFGLSAFDSKLILVDQFDGTKLKIRTLNPATGEVVTVKSILTADRNIVGPLSDKARIRYSYIRGIKYIEDYGLVVGTVYGLLRLQ